VPGVLGDDPVGAVDEAAANGIDRIAVPVFLFLSDTEDALAAWGAKVIAPSASAA
jgi:hypothetical protein